MTNAATDDPLAGWDPRRRAALDRIRAIFKAADGDQVGFTGILAEHGCSPEWEAVRCRTARLLASRSASQTGERHDAGPG